MSLHYLLDGYNIIHQIPGLPLKKLESQRLALIRFVESSCPQGSLNNRITIVFDGKEGICNDLTSVTVRIVFSKGESADQKIKKMVDVESQKKSVVVVTDDRDIQYAVRALGAKVMTVKTFVQKLIPQKKGCPLNNKENKMDKNLKHISKTLEHKINMEFQEIWLKKRNKE